MTGLQHINQLKEGGFLGEEVLIKATVVAGDLRSEQGASWQPLGVQASSAFRCHKGQLGHS